MKSREDARLSGRPQASAPAANSCLQRESKTRVVDGIIAGWVLPWASHRSSGEGGSSSQIFALHLPLGLAELSGRGRTSPALPPAADNVCPLHLLLVSC